MFDKTEEIEKLLKEEIQKYLIEDIVANAQSEPTVVYHFEKGLMIGFQMACTLMIEEGKRLNNKGENK